VIGRVIEVANNRWKLDVNARQHAVLQIGAVSLHGGVHRRRTVDDTLQMRSYFVENDLLVADVQSTYADGSIALHVPKSYHKLDNGVFVSVSPSLIRRVKTHFCSLPCGIDIIIGNNGYIWITPSLTEDEIELRNAEDSTWTPGPITKDVRLAMARVRNSISILAQLFNPIFPDTIMHIFNNSLAHNVADMLKPEIIHEVSQGLENIQTSV
jgi:exosome complex component RRP4